MKKIYSIFTLCLLLFGLSSVITAQTYSYTFKTGDFGTGTAGTSGTASFGSVSWSYSQNGGYLGFDNTKGLQIGSSASPAKAITLSTTDIQGTIKSIKVNTSGASGTSATLSATVNGSAFGTKASLTTSATDYTFSGSASGTILLSWTVSAKAVYIKSIQVTYETITATPTITTNSESLSFSGEVGSSIAAQTINVTAANLTDIISTSISGTDAGLFSVTPSSLSTTGGSLSITYTPTATGSHSATLTLKSAGAADKTIALTGTATAASVPTPTATTPSVEKIDMDKFTATWNATSGADNYILNVYTKSTTSDPVEESETEGFDNVVANGNIIGSATYLDGWEVSVSGTRQIYTSATNFGTSAPSIAFSETGAYLKTRTYSGNIKTFSFWAKQQSGATSSTLIEGYNGTDWVTIINASNADFATAGVVTYDLITLGYTNISQIRMTYTKVAGNLAIDDVSVVYNSTSRNAAAEARVPVSGYQNLSVGNVLNKEVTGLAEATNYFYTVKAVQNGIESAESNEVGVTTLSTPLSIIDNKTVDNDGVKVYKQGQNIIVESGNNTSVFVYTIAGKLISSKSLADGKTTITVPNGVYIVKAGNRTIKIIL